VAASSSDTIATDATVPTTTSTKFIGTLMTRAKLRCNVPASSSIRAKPRAMTMPSAKTELNSFPNACPVSDSDVDALRAFINVERNKLAPDANADAIPPIVVLAIQLKMLPTIITNLHY
jgi:hypothetical protein